MIRKLLFLLVCIGSVLALHAQESKEDIQKKQQQLQQEINELNRTLNTIKSSKKKSLSQLALVQRKIAARQELIGSINKDLKRLDNTIYLNQVEINRMKQELDTLKMNYAKNLVFAYRNRSNYDYLNFIFSATSFNDAIKRVSYLKSYRQYRETQVNTIEKTQQILEDKLNTLSSNKLEKRNALQDQSKQLGVLTEDKKQQDQVVTQLKGQEKDIASQIKTNQRTQQKLKSALQVIISREIAEAKRKADALAKQKAIEEQKKRDAAAANNTVASNNNNASGANNNTSNSASAPANNTTASTGAAAKSNRVYNPLESTPEGLTESLNFENNRGRLPWPVSSGIVTIPFGNYQIPGTLLTGNSDGITISLPAGSSVKSVADGVVSTVLDVDGQGVVVVRHGKYFTAYSNLASTSVSSGAEVHAGTVLGKAAAGADGDGEVGFRVINGTSFVNPQSWLKSR